MAREAMASGTYHLVVLDEFTYLLTHGMLDLQSALDTLHRRPDGLHVAVTGRGAPGALTAAADLVTEMQAVKHPHQAGIKAQKGIEY